MLKVTIDTNSYFTGAGGGRLERSVVDINTADSVPQRAGDSAHSENRQHHAVVSLVLFCLQRDKMQRFIKFTSEFCSYLK